MYNFSLVKGFSSSTHSYLEYTAKDKIISSYPRKKILPNKRTSRNVSNVSYFQCFPTIMFGTPSGRIVTAREKERKIPKIVAYLSYSAGCKHFDRTEIQKVVAYLSCYSGHTYFTRTNSTISNDQILTNI